MVAFKDLWYRHPANNSTTYPCVAPFGLTNMEGQSIRQGNPVFGNQCAIRMGVCLKNAGVSPGTLRMTTCSVHPAEEMHIIRADDLARGLAGSPPSRASARWSASRLGGRALLQADLRSHRHHLCEGLLEAPWRDDGHR